MSSLLETIPARKAVATVVERGQTIKIINTSGTQVIDTWAFAFPRPPRRSQYLSMPHTRAHIQRLIPRPGDMLVSNVRMPLLKFVEDRSPGAHDTLIAACDPQRYRGLGVERWAEHGSCAENLVTALAAINAREELSGDAAVGGGVTVDAIPPPLNLFMNIPWDQYGKISFEAPKGKAGDYVVLKAEVDLVIIMSACPQDVLKINANNPTDAHFIIE